MGSASKMTEKDLLKPHELLVMSQVTTAEFLCSQINLEKIMLSGGALGELMSSCILLYGCLDVQSEIDNE